MKSLQFDVLKICMPHASSLLSALCCCFRAELVSPQRLGHVCGVFVVLARNNYNRAYRGDYNSTDLLSRTIVC